MVRLSLLLGWLLTGTCAWAEDVKQPHVLPSEVVIDGEHGPVVMKLTGYANRELLGRKVYLISSYCDHRSTVENAADLLAFEGMKQLRIRMLRRLPSSLIASTIRRSFDACDKQNQLADEIKLIEDHLRTHPFDVGDEIILTSLEATSISCQINDAEPIVVHKPALVQVVWSVYFDDPPYLGKSIPRGLTRLILPRDPACVESGDDTETIQRTATRADDQ